VFATTVIDSAAIDNLPENAVPDILIQGATHMPEVEKVKTTMHGPASRMHMFCR
jgi:predicted phosphodiesterase